MSSNGKPCSLEIYTLFNPDIIHFSIHMSKKPLEEREYGLGSYFELSTFYMTEL